MFHCHWGVLLLLRSVNQKLRKEIRINPVPKAEIDSLKGMQQAWTPVPTPNSTQMITSLSGSNVKESCSWAILFPHHLIWVGGMETRGVSRPLRPHHLHGCMDSFPCLAFAWPWPSEFRNMQCRPGQDYDPVNLVAGWSSRKSERHAWRSRDTSVFIFLMKGSLDSFDGTKTCSFGKKLMSG